MNTHEAERGQVIVLFAGGILALLLVAALAIDISQVWAVQGKERAAADSAALAGAQDLQTPGSRAVDATDYVNARTHALADLESALQGVGSGCDPTNDIFDCPLTGTPFVVSIQAPSPAAIDVEASRAVMVTVDQPSVPLTFARLAGQNGWNVGITSVAGIEFSGQYAVITLRPPQNTNRTGWGCTLTNCTGTPPNSGGDITIGSTGGGVNAVTGDIGMNLGAELNGNCATVSVPDGYYVRYYGAYTDQTKSTCTGAPPPDAYKQLRALVPDPGYTIPTPPSGYPSDPAPDTGTTCTKLTADAITYGYAPTGTTFTCLVPGIYTSQLVVGKSGPSNVLLESSAGTGSGTGGVYWFEQGIQINNGGVLIGGIEPNQPGVAVIVPEGQPFGEAGNATTLTLALNRGSAFLNGNTDCYGTTDCATAAQLPDGTPVQTNTKPDPMVISVIVDPYHPMDVYCSVTVPSPSCTDQTIKWVGSGSKTVTAIAGVVYGPSDNMTVAGSNNPSGYVGQLVAWTIDYVGNSSLNQYYPGGVMNGSVRLDQECSGGTQPCQQ